MRELSKYQTKCKLKKGDEVVVLSGKNKGETGKIDRIDRKHHRVYLVGMNLVKRHTKPNLSNQEGGIVEKVMPLHWSTVALYDAKKKKASRIGYKIDGEKKARVAKASGAILT